MTTPSSAPGYAPLTEAGKPEIAIIENLEPLRRLSAKLAALATCLGAAAATGNADQVWETAEALLPLHVTFAQEYRSWLARGRPEDRQAALALQPRAAAGDPGSDKADRMSV